MLPCPCYGISGLLIPALAPWLLLQSRLCCETRELTCDQQHPLRSISISSLGINAYVVKMETMANG